MSAPAPILCGRCGYDVRGLPSSTCPECGGDLNIVGVRKQGRGLLNSFTRGHWLIALTVTVLLCGMFAGRILASHITVRHTNFDQWYIGGPGVGTTGGIEPIRVYVVLEYEASEWFVNGIRRGPPSFDRVDVITLPQESAGRLPLKVEAVPEARRTSITVTSGPSNPAVANALERALAADPNISTEAAASLAAELVADLQRPGASKTFTSSDGFWWWRGGGGGSSGGLPKLFGTTLFAAGAALWLAGFFVIRRLVPAAASAR